MFEVTEEDFKLIHNGRCKLFYAMDRLKEVLSQNLYSELDKGLEEMNKGLQSLYNQDREHFEKRNTLYNMIKTKYGLTGVWSIYTVSDFFANSNLNASKLIYEGYDGEVFVNVEGDTWLDLWRAADQALRLSEDNHHIFIEAFVPSKKSVGTVRLVTGS